MKNPNPASWFITKAKSWKIKQSPASGSHGYDNSMGVNSSHDIRRDSGELEDADGDIIMEEDNSKIDFLGKLPYEVAVYIASFTDYKTLCTMNRVSRAWRHVTSDNEVWKVLFQRNAGWEAKIPKTIPYPSQPVVHPSPILVPMELSGRTSSEAEITISPPIQLNWKYLYKQRYLLEHNWRNGNIKCTTLSGHSDSVYCIQFDEEKLVSGSRDQTIKFWSLKDGKVVRTYKGHTGSVLCLQYNDKVLISGSSDTTIILWDIYTGNKIRTLHGHSAGVLDIGFDDKYIVSCSKDYTIKVWDFNTGNLIHTLTGHRAAVNAIQLRDGVIVSASGDYLIKMWDVKTGQFIRDFVGHTRGIACVQYDGKYIVSGSNDQTIKIWNAKSGECLNTLYGHSELVRTLHCDRNFIVSGSYDQTVKVWDFKTGDLLMDLNKGHTSWVFNVQFNLGKIVSASQDQTMVIWDFSHNVDTRFLV